MARRGQAGRTHCGSWRLATAEDLLVVPGWFGCRFACTERPHSAGPHRNRYAMVEWVGGGPLRRYEEA